jgi:hypothetical protein
MSTDEITSVEVRTIDGETWLNARHVTQRLRELAQENRDASLALTGIRSADDDLPLNEDDYVKAVMFHAAAQRFDETADKLDLAVIEHISKTDAE